MSLVSGSAIVTGGGSGIGQAIAEALGKAGAQVAVVDLLPEGGKAVADQIGRRGGKAHFVAADVSRWEDVDHAPVDEMSPALWTKVIAINLSAHSSGASAPWRRWHRQGAVINLASVAGLVGDGGGPAYVASKHGVVGLTRQLAVSQAARGVTVNAICPGLIQTGLRANSTSILAPTRRSCAVSAATRRPSRR